MKDKWLHCGTGVRQPVSESLLLTLIAQATPTLVYIPHWEEIVNSKAFRAVMSCMSFHIIPIQIYYVDYGNIDWVPETELRLMKPEFMNLPFQAVECYLAGVLMSSGSTPDVSKEEETE